MQLYFIRHAQSTNNLLWDQTNASTGRSMDPDLTDKGWRQARRLAKYLRDNQVAYPTDIRDSHNAYGFGLTHLYTSLMVRSVLTATPLAEAIGKPLQAWVDIHETGGIFLDDEATGLPQGLPGRTRSYLTERFSHLVLPDDLADAHELR